MRVEDWDRLNDIAESVSSQLLADLRSGVIKLIDVDLIKRRLREHSKFPKDFVLYTRLEDMTIRKVVAAATQPKKQENPTVNPKDEQYGNTST